MNRRLRLVGCVFAAVVLGLAALMLRNKPGGKVTVSFVNAEPSHGQFPLYEESVRLAFAVRNSGARNLIIEIRAIEDEQGNWSPSYQSLGEVEARQSAQRYLYLPQGSHPRSVRVLVMKRANVIEKTQDAMRLLVKKAAGRYSGNSFWFDRLIVARGEFEVRLWNDSKPNDAGPGSDTNHNIGRSGSGR